MQYNIVYVYIYIDSWLVVSTFFYVHPYLGKWSNLTNNFQIGWDHQLDLIFYQNLFFPAQKTGFFHYILVH